MKTIPVIEVAAAPPTAARRTVAPPARTAAEPYRAYKPRPFTRAERDDVTLLFGGLHWRAERVAQASLENLGYKVQVLPTATGAAGGEGKGGRQGLVRDQEDLDRFVQSYGTADWRSPGPTSTSDPVLVGCDFGSTTAKAVVLSLDCELLFSCYALSNGNPIEDAKALFRQLRHAGSQEVAALALTGYGKDLLKSVIGADLGIVETVAHATAARAGVRTRSWLASPRCCHSMCGCTPDSSRISPPRAASSSCRAERTATWL